MSEIVALSFDFVRFGVVLVFRLLGPISRSRLGRAVHGAARESSTFAFPGRSDWKCGDTG